MSRTDRNHRREGSEKQSSPCWRHRREPGRIPTIRELEHVSRCALRAVRKLGEHELIVGSPAKENGRLLWTYSAVESCTCDEQLADVHVLKSTSYLQLRSIATSPGSLPTIRPQSNFIIDVRG